MKTIKQINTEKKRKRTKKTISMIGPKEPRNEESRTECGENKTFLKIYEIIFNIAKDRNQWIGCHSTEETSERAGDCVVGGWVVGKEKRAWRGCLGTCMSMFVKTKHQMDWRCCVLVPSFTYFPAFVPCMCSFLGLPWFWILPTVSFLVFSATPFSLLLPLFFSPGFFYALRPNQMKFSRAHFF